MTTVLVWEHYTKRSSEASSELGDHGNPFKIGELVFAADSRFSGGETWDSNAKIFNLGRDDCLLAFAGDIGRALPLVFQAISSANSFEGSRLRTIDIPQFANHLVKILNSVWQKAHGAAAKDGPDCEFILGGWSWAYCRFFIYKIQFNEKLNRFCKHVVKNRIGVLDSVNQIGNVGIIGDGDRGLIRELGNLAREGDLIASREADENCKLGLSLPVEALYKQTLSGEDTSVGGPVQVSIVSQRVSVEHLAVGIEGSIYINGREKLANENYNLRTLIRTKQLDWRIM